MSRACSRPFQRAILCAAVSGALAISTDAAAVRIGADGLGEALIYPYYTVQSTDGNSFNTYLSVVNHTPDAKAVRVRFREGRMGAEVASFNLFLAPNDAWTGAIVPSEAGARLLTADVSCTDPAFGSGAPPFFMDFRNGAFSGANDDGAGTGLDRTREGYVEMIEMATLTGASAAAVTHNSLGVPTNCAAVQSGASVLAAAQTGGLSGTVSLINVQSGVNFDLNAVALDDLATRPFYRPAGDPYPDFNAAEIDPVSVVVANGAAYRATWGRSIDAVSAVFMAQDIQGEYVLDDATASNTDFVATFPTRRFYVTATSAQLPFSQPSRWAPHCEPSTPLAGELIEAFGYDREGRATVLTPDACGFDCAFTPPANICAATVVMDVSNRTPHTAITSQSRVLGSLVHGFGPDGLMASALFTHGWIKAVFNGTGPAVSGLASLPSSTRMDLATGAITSGSQTYYGLPVVGFAARTFVNGTLTCAAGACQGNYGGAFPFQYTRRIAP